MNFRIAPMAEQHIEAFHAVLDHVAKERRYLLFLEAPPLEEVRKFVRPNLTKGYPVNVALVEECVVGWCDILPINRPTRAHTGVLGLAVVAEHRRCGIGSALLRATLEWARKAGLTRIELMYRIHNRHLGPFYERFGFVVEGRQRNAIRLDGAYEDAVCMALLLE